MKKFIRIFFITLIFSVTGLVVYSQPDYSNADIIRWEKIGNGIEFSEQSYGKWFKKGKLYAVRISNPRKLKILTGPPNGTTIEDLEKKYKSLVTINGSYFQENYQPSGLLKVENKILYKLNKFGGSGILAINNTEINIFNKKDINIIKKTYPNLMQNGPLLVEDYGKPGIYSDDHEYTARTAIGITKNNKVIIVIADMTSSPSLWELASLLAKDEHMGGFSCRVALNLDGGSSTGLRINLPSKKLIIPESNYIANGLGVF